MKSSRTLAKFCVCDGIFDCVYISLAAWEVKLSAEECILVVVVDI